MEGEGEKTGGGCRIRALKSWPPSLTGFSLGEVQCRP